jgi:hypothetical protein
MVPPRVRSHRSFPGIRLALIAGLALLMLLPTGAIAAPRNSTPNVAPAAKPAAGAFAPVVTWNGVNVDTAGSASSALSVDFSSTASVLFNWTIPTTPGFVDPNDGRLQMIYFGFALATRDVVTSGPPVTSIPMGWNPGALVYILEGVYKITASLVTGNGTTVWSENFYVRASAPFSIAALLPIILIVLIAWELYSVARSGRQALLSQKGKAPPTPPEEAAPAEPTTPPSGEEAPPSEPEESGTPPSGPEEPT